MTAIVNRTAAESSSTAWTPSLGQVLTPCGFVLLEPDHDGTWIALTSEDTLTVVNLDTFTPTGETVSHEQIVQRLVTIQQLLEERAERTQDQVRELHEKFADVREYAVARHREGHYCISGLNEALEHFGLDPYRPRYRVPVTVHAYIELNADSEDEAVRRARYVIDGIAYSGEHPDEEIDAELDYLDTGDAETV